MRRGRAGWWVPTLFLGLAFSGCFGGGGGADVDDDHENVKERLSLSQPGEQCPSFISTPDPRNLSEKRYHGVWGAQILLIAYSWFSDGDRGFNVTCDTIQIKMNVDWDPTLVPEARVWMRCIQDDVIASGPPPIKFTLNHTHVLFPDFCRPHIAPNPNVGPFILALRHEFNWDARVVDWGTEATSDEPQA